MRTANFQDLIDQANGNTEAALLAYSNITQSLTPRVDDTIQIELPTGDRWIVIHLPSAEQVTERERIKSAKFDAEIRVMLAFLCAVFGAMLVVATFLPYHGHASPGQHLRNMRVFSWGIFLLILGAFTLWCKPKVVSHGSGTSTD